MRPRRAPARRRVGCLPADRRPRRQVTLQPDEAVTSATASQEWSAFLNYTTAVLHPYEHCDCMRHNSRPGDYRQRSHIAATLRIAISTCAASASPTSPAWAETRTTAVWWPGDANSLRTSTPSRHTVAVGAAQRQQRRDSPAADAAADSRGLLRGRRPPEDAAGETRLVPMCHLYHPLASMRSWLPRVWSGRHTLISIVTRPAEVLSALLLTRNCALSMRRFVRRDSRASL